MSVVPVPAGRHQAGRTPRRSGAADRRWTGWQPDACSGRALKPTVSPRLPRGLAPVPGRISSSPASSIRPVVSGITCAVSATMREVFDAPAARRHLVASAHPVRACAGPSGSGSTGSVLPRPQPRPRSYPRRSGSRGPQRYLLPRFQNPGAESCQTAHAPKQAVGCFGFWPAGSVFQILAQRPDLGVTPSIAARNPAIASSSGPSFRISVTCRPAGTS